jgi:hypothetical protein
MRLESRLRFRFMIYNRLTHVPLFGSGDRDSWDLASSRAEYIALTEPASREGMNRSAE